MISLAAVVEGPTEKRFVQDLLAEHLRGRDVNIWAQLPGTPDSPQGGMPSWDSVRKEILRTLRERRGQFCTTMFDFYGMPKDWPGRSSAAGSPHQKGESVERAMMEDVAEEAGKGFRRELFVPYVQMHEFEAILFSDVRKMAEALESKASGDLVTRFKAVLDEAGQPEAINDHYDTCPSRRITGEVRTYRKRLHGPIIAREIKLDAIRAACPHFDAWLGRIESLTSQARNA